MNGKADRGRKIVVAVIAAGLSTSALVIFASILASGTDGIAWESVRFALAVLLSLFLYRGASWARWITIVLTGAAGIGWIIVALAQPLGPRPGVFLLGVAAVYLVCAAALLLNGAVRLHFARGRTVIS